MKWDIILYEISILLLIIICIYCGIVLHKLTSVIKEKNYIWILPVISSAFLLLSLLSHIYASFILMPELSKAIETLTSNAGLTDEKLFASAKSAIDNIKLVLVQLRAFSFTAFLIAAVLLATSSIIYIRKISK